MEEGDRRPEAVVSAAHALRQAHYVLQVQGLGVVGRPPEAVPGGQAIRSYLAVCARLQGQNSLRSSFKTVELDLYGTGSGKIVSRSCTDTSTGFTARQTSWTHLS